MCRGRGCRCNERLRRHRAVGRLNGEHFMLILPWCVPPQLASFVCFSSRVHKRFGLTMGSFQIQIQRQIQNMLVTQVKPNMHARNSCAPAAGGCPVLVHTPTPTPTPTPGAAAAAPTSPGSGFSLYVLIGVGGGGVLVLVCVVFAIYKCCCKSSTPAAAAAAAPPKAHAGHHLHHKGSGDDTGMAMVVQNPAHFQQSNPIGYQPRR